MQKAKKNVLKADVCNVMHIPIGRVKSDQSRLSIDFPESTRFSESTLEIYYINLLHITINQSRGFRFESEKSRFWNPLM